MSIKDTLANAAGKIVHGAESAVEAVQHNPVTTAVVRAATDAMTTTRAEAARLGDLAAAEADKLKEHLTK